MMDFVAERFNCKFEILYAFLFYLRKKSSLVLTAYFRRFFDETVFCGGHSFLVKLVSVISFCNDTKVHLVSKYTYDKLIFSLIM